jgi:8-oxo-dGTP pyrophosphatase MutT (NUDIX family)
MIELKKWEIISEEDISPDKWFPLFKHKVRLPNGNIIDDYFISKLGDVAMIIPVTPEQELIFVKQYKHGIREITLEFPAGIVEEGQTPLQAAYSELEQETGIVATNMTLIGELKTLPSKNFANLYGFLAIDVTITKPQNLDVSEEIQVIKLTKEQVDEKILNGEINCSDTIALYALFRLRSK